MYLILDKISMIYSNFLIEMISLKVFRINKNNFI